MLTRGCLNVASSWDWGTVPNWFAAVGTVSAFGWAVFVYRTSVRDAHLAQPRRVFATAHTVKVDAGSAFHSERGLYDPGTLSPPILVGDVGRMLNADASRTTVRVVNASDEPVSNVHVQLYAAGSGEPLEASQWVLPVVLPNAEATVDFVLSLTPNRHGIREHRVVVTFTASDGSHWWREGAMRVQPSRRNPWRGVSADPSRDRLYQNDTGIDHAQWLAPDPNSPTGRQPPIARSLDIRSKGRRKHPFRFR